MIPARVEAHPRTCATCVHHQRPTWPTGGRGTCVAGLIRIQGGGYVVTESTFACSEWTDQRAAR